jgi:uncharacterized membrane-anchored protein
MDIEHMTRTTDRFRWIAFALMAAFMLGVPAWMIIGHERVLTQGEVFLFRTAPVDPHDPFRGEYVRLRFEAETGEWASPIARGDGVRTEKAWAVLEKDEEGFARIARLAAERTPGVPAVTVTWSTYGDGPVTRVTLPFDRFYLQEGKGATTEKLLSPTWEDGVRSDPLPAHAVVRVLDGKAVIEDLVVDGRPIQDWLIDQR